MDSLLWISHLENLGCCLKHIIHRSHFIGHQKFPPPKMNFLQFGSYKTATVMTVAVSLVGFILLLGGAVLTGMSFTEVRPNYADENYNRYMGAHLQRTVGPVMLAFGFVLMVGGCVFLGFIMFSSQHRTRTPSSARGSMKKEMY